MPPPNEPGSGSNPLNPLWEVAPRRIYNIVDPIALARVYAAGMMGIAEAGSATPHEQRSAGRAAVLNFVRLMREELPDEG